MTCFKPGAILFFTFLVILGGIYAITWSSWVFHLNSVALISSLQHFPRFSYVLIEHTLSHDEIGIDDRKGVFSWNKFDVVATIFCTSIVRLGPIHVFWLSNRRWKAKIYFLFKITYFDLVVPTFFTFFVRWSNLCFGITKSPSVAKMYFFSEVTFFDLSVTTFLTFLVRLGPL